MDKWEGHVAVVTGASSGIGKAIALKLAEHGMKVAALARRENLLKELSESFRGKGMIRGYVCDVTEEEKLDEIFNRVEAEMGHIRVLVNNAGIGPYTPLLDFDIETWKKTFDVNIFGMFACIKRVINLTKKNNPGLLQIINMNSTSGHEVFDDTGIFIYTTTKHCMTLLTRLLNRQIASHNLDVKVTNLSPGLVTTDFFDLAGWANKINLQDWPFLKPDAVAESVLTVLQVPSNVLINEFSVKPKGQFI